MSRRVGLGRALAFGCVSVAAPALHHGLSTGASAVIVALAALAFAVWSCSRGCAPRSASAIAASLVAAQLVVHVSLPVNAHAHVDPAGVLMMVAAHASAIVLGVIVLASLERRALRAAVACVELVAAAISRRMDGRAMLIGASALADGAAEILQRAAHAAAARRIRRACRVHAHRGPPGVAGCSIAA